MKPSADQPLSTATLHILLALADEDLHGYGIIQKAARQSQTQYRLGPGTLYDNLRKLLEQKLVEDAPPSASPGDERRLYRLTPDGRVFLNAELSRLRRVLEEADASLGVRRPKQV